MEVILDNELPGEVVHNITAVIDDFWQVLNILCDERGLLNSIGDYNISALSEIYPLLADLLHVKYSKRIRLIQESVTARKRALNLTHDPDTNKHRINGVSSMGLSEFSIAIDRFRELLSFVIAWQDRKTILKYLSSEDCENLNKANKELGEVCKMMNKPNLKRKKPDRPKSA